MTVTAAKSTSPGLRVAFTVITVVMIVTVFGLLAETVVRVRQWMKYGTASTVEGSFMIDPASGLRIPDPDKLPQRIRLNSLGFRSPELASPKSPGTIRLAFLGGSTTYCGEVSSNEGTWPHLVWRTLQAARSQATFDFLNAGVPGYGMDALLKTLEFRVKPLRPDIIIIYEATNDLSFDSAALARERGLLRGRPDEGSSIGRYSLLWFLVEKNLTVGRRQAAATSTAGKLIVDPRDLSRGFEQRLIKLVEASREVAPLVAIATFAPRLRRGQSPDEQTRAAVTAAYYMPHMTIDGLIAGYEEYNRVIREVAAREGAVLIEAADAIPADAAHYTDSVHFTDAGSRAMAERVSTTLLSAPAFATLLSSGRAGGAAGHLPAEHARSASSRPRATPSTASR